MKLNISTSAIKARILNHVDVNDVSQLDAMAESIMWLFKDKVIEYYAEQEWEAHVKEHKKCGAGIDISKDDKAKHYYILGWKENQWAIENRKEKIPQQLFDR